MSGREARIQDDYSRRTIRWSGHITELLNVWAQKRQLQSQARRQVNRPNVPMVQQALG